MTLAQARAQYNKIRDQVHVKVDGDAFNKLYDDPNSTFAQWQQGCAVVSADDYAWARAIQTATWPASAQSKADAVVSALVQDAASYLDCSKMGTRDSQNTILNSMGAVQSAGKPLAAFKFALGFPTP
jgi:hypothetical protein